jgi:hypothetical protein
LGRALAVPLSPLLALAGCAAPWPEVPAGPGSTSARARLREAAEAHGVAAWQGVHDVNLGYDALPWPATRGLQRGGPAQMRLLQAGGQLALHADPMDPGATPLAAALHRLLLLGPIALANVDGPVNWAEPQTLAGHRCDHLHLRLSPGLGTAGADRLSLFIDRDEGLLRRLQASLTGLGPDTLVQVDVDGHRRLAGVTWPTRWQSGALAWQLTGLDLNRGYGPEALRSTPWAAPADAPARALPTG